MEQLQQRVVALVVVVRQAMQVVTAARVVAVVVTQAAPGVQVTSEKVKTALTAQVVPHTGLVLAVVTELLAHKAQARPVVLAAQASPTTEIGETSLRPALLAVAAVAVTLEALPVTAAVLVEVTASTERLVRTALAAVVAAVVTARRRAAMVVTVSSWCVIRRQFYLR